MVECCICLEQFQLDGDKTPKLLPCSHTLCLQCLQQLSNGRPSVQCPLCRAHHEAPGRNVIHFPTNRHVLDNLKSLEIITSLQHNVRSGHKVPVVQRMIYETELAKKEVIKLAVLGEL